MSPRVLVLVLINICFLDCSNADWMNWATGLLVNNAGTIVNNAGFIVNNAGFIVDNAENVGIPLPGLMALLSKKSNFLTNLLHYLFGGKIEKNFRELIANLVKFMPESEKIDDVESDNKEGMTFTNGVIEGLNSFDVTPKTGVEVMWSWSWTGPSAVVSVYFQRLTIQGHMKGKVDYTWKDFIINGPVTMKVIENNFVLTFNLYPGFSEGCYLKLTDVSCTDMEQLALRLKDAKGQDDNSGGFVLQEYFLRHESLVADHIKISVANKLFQEIPKASPHICDNDNEVLRLSKYQTYKKTHKATDKIVLFDVNNKIQKTKSKNNPE